MHKYIHSLMLSLFAATIAYSGDSVDEFNELSLIGKWENVANSELLYFYRKDNSSQLMLNRYQLTPKSFLLEQNPIELSQNDFDAIQVKNGCLEADEQEFHRTNRELNIYPSKNCRALDVFDVLVENFTQHYAFFELRGVDWPELSASYSKQISYATTEKGLFEIFKSMLSELRDNHVCLVQGLSEESGAYYGFYLRPEFNEKLEKHMLGADVPKMSVDEYFDELSELAATKIAASRLSSNQKRDGLVFGLLRGHENIGYLNIINMKDISVEAIDQAIALYNKRRITGLMIDVRFNMGGDDDLALAVAERFATRRTLVLSTETYYGAGSKLEASHRYLEPKGKKQIWNKDIKIAVLTSPVTASAAEAFVVATSALSNVTRVGDTTMGIMSDQFARVLPNGWFVTLSNQMNYGPDGRLYENIGVPVHVATEFPFYGLSKRVVDQGIVIATDILQTQLSSFNIHKEKIVWTWAKQDFGTNFD